MHPKPSIRAVIPEISGIMKPELRRTLSGIEKQQPRDQIRARATVDFPSKTKTKSKTKSKRKSKSNS